MKGDGEWGQIRSDQVRSYQVRSAVCIVRVSDAGARRGEGEGAVFMMLVFGLSSNMRNRSTTLSYHLEGRGMAASFYFSPSSPFRLLVHVSDVVSEDIRIGVPYAVRVQVSDSAVACD